MDTAPVGRRKCWGKGDGRRRRIVDGAGYGDGIEGGRNQRGDVWKTNQYLKRNTTVEIK